jgi:hypothetical protein
VNWLAFLVVMTVTPALAQNIRACGPRQAIIDHLKSNHNETITVQGLSSKGWLLEIFANYEIGSWTIISTNPNSLSCLQDEGESWILIPRVKETEAN